MLIWCFVTLNRVKTATGKAVRRVLNITELAPKVGGYELKDLCSWDAASDSFIPGSAEEIVGNSRRVEVVARLAGWSRDRIVDEINLRAKWLAGNVEEGEFSYRDFSESIRRFYVKRRRGELEP